MHDITALDSADAIEAAEIAAMKVDDGLLAESAAVDALRERQWAAVLLDGNPATTHVPTARKSVFMPAGHVR